MTWRREDEWPLVARTRSFLQLPPENSTFITPYFSRSASKKRGQPTAGPSVKTPRQSSAAERFDARTTRRSWPYQNAANAQPDPATRISSAVTGIALRDVKTSQP